MRGNWIGTKTDVRLALFKASLVSCVACFLSAYGSLWVFGLALELEKVTFGSTCLRMPQESKAMGDSGPCSP